MSFNPFTQQGNLNRLYTNVIVPNFPALNVTAPYMGKGQAHLTFDGNFNNQIPTATSIVNAPEPYIMAHISVNLLRSQPLANLWLAQVQSQTIIGPVTIYSDSTAFAAITLLQCSIMGFDPGAYDGSDPVLRVTITGQYPINNSMWSGAASGALGSVGGLGSINGLV